MGKKIYSDVKARRDAANARRRQWRKDNPDKAIEADKVYRKRAGVKLARRAAEYKKKYPERVKASLAKTRDRRLAYSKEKYREARRKVIAAYGGRCVCCGEKNECFLTIDHARNDGAAHRRARKEDGEQYKGCGAGMYRWLVLHGFPKDGRFQLLCYNCNCSKHHDPTGHRAAHANAKLIDGLGEIL